MHESGDAFVPSELGDEGAQRPACLPPKRGRTGRGLLYPTACDGALKLLEVAYMLALAFTPEEIRHGPPVAVADEDFVLVVLASSPRWPGSPRRLAWREGWSSPSRTTNG